MGRESSSVSSQSPQPSQRGSSSTRSFQRAGSSSRGAQHVQLQRAAGLTLVANTPKGRGVFASERIPAKTVIEVCPVLVLDPKDVGDHVSKTVLDHYTYNWPWRDGAKTQVIVLGLGSMFNHSTYLQNVGWKRDLQNECITYFALVDILPNEELCISYGNGRLWFHDADAEAESCDHAQQAESAGMYGLERIETS